MRAVSQEAVFKVKDFVEITTEEELKDVLAEQCNLELPVTMRIRKSFGYPIASRCDQHAGGNRQD